MTTKMFRSPFLLALGLLAFVCPASPAQETWESWVEETPTLAAIEAQLVQVGAREGELPADAAPDSLEGALAAALARRAALLGELLALLQRHQEVAERLANRAALEAEAERELAELATEVRAAPTDVAPEAVLALETEAKALRAEVLALRTRVTEAAARADAQGERRAGLEARAGGAELRAEGHVADPGGEDEVARALRELRLANALLDARTASSAAELLDRELEGDGALGRLRSLSLDLAEQRLALTEEDLAAARDALASSLERDRVTAMERLAETERAAEAEQDPVERFLAEKEVATLRAGARAAELEPATVQLGRAADEQTARLDSDRQELERLRKEVESFGTGGRVGARLRDVFKQLEARRRAVELAMAPRLAESVSEWRSRRFDLDEILYGLGGTWRAEVDATAAAAGLTNEQRELLRAEAAPLRGAYRTAVEEERATLTELITRAERLRGLQTERLAALRELGTFVHAKVFWIRDGSQLELEALRKIPGELQGVARFGAQAASSESLAALAAGFRDPANLAWGLLVLALPAALWLVRRFLRRRIASLEDPERPRAGAWRAALLILCVLADAILLPAYLLVLGRVLADAGLPAGIGLVLSGVLQHVALFLFAGLLARRAFGDPLLAQRFLGLPADTCASAYRALRTVLVAYLVLLLPWAVLRREPFAQQVLPLVALVLFLFVTAFSLHRLFRARSPLVRDLFGGEISRLESWRPVWDGVLALLLLVVPVLTASGFSFAASTVGQSLVWSLALLVLLPAAYRATMRWMDRVHARREPRARDGDDALEPQARKWRDLRTLVRAAFVVTGVLVLASLWGINQQAWGVLEGLHVWRTNALSAEVAEYVSVADLILGMGSLVITFWLLRNLPGIYDLALFPRLNLDAGLRYAIVTISRYGLFFVGCMIALSFIHLDLTRLGWLVAAMGVGLGFGLQEIVSNFVSGIILLVERPIRVGDLVTVGGVSGRVQRINIRATTLVNFDRLEVIVPNRSLITQDVTNWTLADEMTRLVVPIGVAYGSDIDQVRALLTQIVKGQPEVLTDPAPQVVFVSHGESSLDFEVRCFLGRTADRVPIQDRLNTQINRVFAEHGVEIPFPQRDLHFRTELLVPVAPPRPAADASRPVADSPVRSGP